MDNNFDIYRTDEWFESLKWQHQWIDRMVAWWVGTFGRPQSVLDFGAGDGWWCNSFNEMGCPSTTAIELDELARKYMPEKVSFIRHDLREPLDLGFQVDLVICLEVAEHIPPQYASRLVTTLCKHSANRVLFSSAPPGQSGTGHINLQQPEYWRKMFAGMKLAFDAPRTGATRCAFQNIVKECFDFLPRNIQVFSRLE